MKSDYRSDVRCVIKHSVNEEIPNAIAIQFTKKHQQFDCEICDTSFGEKANLQCHAKTIHEKNRTFSCDLCSKTFGEKSGLQKHIGNVHEKKRLFVCELCDTKFGK
eukprot:1112088_1